MRCPSTDTRVNKAIIMRFCLCVRLFKFVHVCSLLALLSVQTANLQPYNKHFKTHKFIQDTRAYGRVQNTAYDSQFQCILSAFNAFLSDALPYCACAYFLCSKCSNKRENNIILINLPFNHVTGYLLRTYIH